jgi:hypothetical protein
MGVPRNMNKRQVLNTNRQPEKKGRKGEKQRAEKNLRAK